MKMFRIPAVATIFLGAVALPTFADDLAAIQQALAAKYSLTTTTADRTDIVTAGSVLVLKKSNLLTGDASKPAVYPNTYKNGRITQSGLFALVTRSATGPIEGARVFVSGEKVWVTAIDVKEKEISFFLFTDPFSDVRYRCKLNFPIEKGSTPTVSGMLATIAEVFDVQGDSGGGQQTSQQPQPQQPAPSGPRGGAPPAAPAVAEAPPPPIAPPPAPPADPKEVKLGQTPDQVTANLGQPDKVVKLGAKQIYVYKDMKVVFVNGKVSDVQ